MHLISLSHFYYVARSRLARGALFGVGTAKARELGSEEGEVASLTMMTAGVFMVLLASALAFLPFKARGNVFCTREFAAGAGKTKPTPKRASSIPICYNPNSLRGALRRLSTSKAARLEVFNRTE
jgi:hypothetical protein